jgi:probable F420-dependent oxidoreductase
MSRGKVDFGIRVPVSGPLASVENIVLAAKEAQQLKFDTVWVHDQLLWSQEQNSHHISSGAVEAVIPGKEPDFYESLTTLGFLAGLTESIKLGVAVLVLPLRNPIVAAKQLMNLDVVSKGRLVLGIGSGAPLVGKTFEAAGVPFESRGELTDDYLKAILAIFQRQSNSTYLGKFSRFTDIEMFPKPVQNPHPPIIIGGLGRAIRRAALYGDGWIPANITPTEISKGVEKMRAVAARHGKNRIDFIIGNEIFTSIDKNSAAARANALATVSSYARSIKRGNEDVTLSGSPSEILKKTEEYVDAGTTMFELKFIYKNMKSLISQMRLFQSEVMQCFA